MTDTYIPGRVRGPSSRLFAALWQSGAPRHSGAGPKAATSTASANLKASLGQAAGLGHSIIIGATVKRARPWSSPVDPPPRHRSTTALLAGAQSPGSGRDSKDSDPQRRERPPPRCVAQGVPRGVSP